MANCKYCGQFISSFGEGVEYEDVIGFLEIQETEYYHFDCKTLYIAKLLNESVENGVNLDLSGIMGHWNITHKMAIKVINKAYSLNLKP